MVMNLKGNLIRGEHIFECEYQLRFKWKNAFYPWIIYFKTILSSIHFANNCFRANCIPITNAFRFIFFIWRRVVLNSLRNWYFIDTFRPISVFELNRPVFQSWMYLFPCSSFDVAYNSKIHLGADILLIHFAQYLFSYFVPSSSSRLRENDEDCYCCYTGKTISCSKFHVFLRIEVDLGREAWACFPFDEVADLEQIRTWILSVFVPGIGGGGF